VLNAHIHATFLLIKTRFDTPDPSCSVAETSSVKKGGGGQKVEEREWKRFYAQGRFEYGFLLLRSGLPYSNFTDRYWVKTRDVGPLGPGDSDIITDIGASRGR
jgi:hypothetical protein